MGVGGEKLGAGRGSWWPGLEAVDDAEVGCVRVLQGGLCIQGVASEGPGVGFWMAPHFQLLQIKILKCWF